MTELLPLHGGQLHQISDRFGIPASELLDFSANINPEGPPAAVLHSLRAALDNLSTLTDYPDLNETELRQALACYANVRLENVAVANGFVPLLDAALRILPIRRCLVPVPAFIEYRRSLERCRIEMIPRNLMHSSDFSYDCDDLLTGSHDAVLLANPQNPSGILSSRHTLLELIEKAAAHSIRVLLDEAFIDYCPEDSLARETDCYPNLIVFRSVTKFFGMPGLRIAYAIANTALCRQLQEAIAPWPITTLASLAACVAVQDKTYAQRTIVLNHDRRKRLQTAIARLGIHVYPPAANFLLLRLPESVNYRGFWERLICEHHIVLRNCANYEALPDEHLRAAVRTDTENERLADALAQVLGVMSRDASVKSHCFELAHEAEKA